MNTTKSGHCIFDLVGHSIKGCQFWMSKQPAYPSTIVTTSIEVKKVQKRPITTAPGIQVSSVPWWSKAPFLNSFLCPAFLPHSLHSRQLCKVYMKGASPFPYSIALHQSACSPLPSPVCIFLIAFPGGFRFWIKVMCFISNHIICMNLLLCSMLVWGSRLTFILTKIMLIDGN